MDNDKVLKISELQRQIEEIKKEKVVSYSLVMVIPDCGGGVMDRRTCIAISSDQTKLINFCFEQFKYTPSFERNSDPKKPCDVWYQIEFTTIVILN